MELLEFIEFARKEVINGRFKLESEFDNNDLIRALNEINDKSIALISQKLELVQMFRELDQAMDD